MAAVTAAGEVVAIPEQCSVIAMRNDVIHVRAAFSLAVTADGFIVQHRQAQSTPAGRLIPEPHVGIRALTFTSSRMLGAVPAADAG